MTATAAPPAPEARHRARFMSFLRVFTGLALMGVLAYFLWTPGEWTVKLMVWVLVTLLADELGGWFGYIGLGLGVLGFLAPETPLQQWLVIFPLVGGALMSLLLVKHSGGPFVLPFGALLFAGTLLAVGRYGGQIDPSLKLPATDSFQYAALLPMLAAVLFSFLRQLVQNFLGYRARTGADRAALAGAGERELAAAPVPAPEPVVPTGADVGPAEATSTTVVVAADPAGVSQSSPAPAPKPAPTGPDLNKTRE